MKKEKNYYSILTADVRYDKRLKPSEKLLFSEITALSNQQGFCWASNFYFADLYEVSKETVSRWIKNLIKYKYIYSELIYKDNSKEIEKRKLTPISIPSDVLEKIIEKEVEKRIDKKVHTYPQKSQHPIDKKVNTPIDKKVKDNTTSINTTVNKGMLSPKSFYSSEINNNSSKHKIKEYSYFVKILFGENEIEEELTEILKIPKQVKYSQFENLLKKAKAHNKSISDILMKMYNSTKYTKNRKSLSLTLNTWIKNDFK